MNFGFFETFKELDHFKYSKAQKKMKSDRKAFREATLTLIPALNKDNAK